MRGVVGYDRMPSETYALGQIRANRTILYLQNIIGVAGSLVATARPLLDMETLGIKRPLDCRQGAYIVSGVGQTEASIHQIRNEQ